MQLLWAILVLFSLSNIAYGQTLPEAESTVEELLIQASSKRALAYQKIDQLPNSVEDEVDRVMTKLDGLFQDKMQERFNKHYKKVEQSLQTVSLPKDVDPWKLALKRYQTLVDSRALDPLVKGFIRQAQTTLEPHREKLVEEIDTQLNETLTVELKQARDVIRAPFQRELIQYFPVWNVPDLRASPLPVLELPGMKGEGRSNVPGAAIGGLLLVILRRRIANLIARKIAGKALGKLIPVIGTLLLGYEVWDAIRAKAELERTLRTQFLSTYQEEFSPNTIWDQPVEEGELSTRRQLEQRVSTSLRAWSEHCRQEVLRMLDAYDVFVLSPKVKDYITKQAGKGRNTQEIIEDMNRVGKVFGQGIIRQKPLGYLLKMIAHAPDTQELTRLARELGTWPPARVRPT